MTALGVPLPALPWIKNFQQNIFFPLRPQWHKTSELLLLSGDLPSLQVHYSSHLSPSQTILIETVSGTHNEQPLNGLVTAMHSHDWKSTFKVTTQVMHFHFIKKIVPECVGSYEASKYSKAGLRFSK